MCPEIVPHFHRPFRGLADLVGHCHHSIEQRSGQRTHSFEEWLAQRERRWNPVAWHRLCTVFQAKKPSLGARYAAATYTVVDGLCALEGLIKGHGCLTRRWDCLWERGSGGEYPSTIGTLPRVCRPTQVRAAWFQDQL